MKVKINNEDVELPVDDNPIYETDADNRDLEDTMEFNLDKDAPIGVMDSGMGGISVLRELVICFFILCK